VSRFICLPFNFLETGVIAFAKVAASPLTLQRRRAAGTTEANAKPTPSVSLQLDEQMASSACRP
jgi:hypothetical protein